jgi:hypothetical protein
MMIKTVLTTACMMFFSANVYAGDTPSALADSFANFAVHKEMSAEERTEEVWRRINYYISQGDSPSTARNKVAFEMDMPSLIEPAAGPISNDSEGQNSAETPAEKRQSKKNSVMRSLRETFGK